MAKWVRHFFKIDIGQGERDLCSGPAYRGLAMVNVSKGRWSLTHMRSGLRVTMISGDRSFAYQAAEAIANLAEWDQHDTAEELMKATPGLIDRLKAIVHSYNDEDELEAGHA